MDNGIDELTLQRMRKNREESLARSLEHGQHAPERFLRAWLKGVRTVGEEFFCFRSPVYDPNIEPAPSISEVTNKWQVCPNREVIEKRIGVLSSGEAALLAIMYSFYNAEVGGGLMRKLGIQGMADVASKLDFEEMDILTELLANYTGW